MNFTKLSYITDDTSTHLSLTTDVSSDAIGAVLHQHVHDNTLPISFFSVKLTPTQKKYSAFFRELLAIYLSIKNFRHTLEGRNFTVYSDTDHKPLTFALNTKSEKYYPRDYRQLDYISQYTTDIRYIRVHDNIVANTLSRPSLCNNVQDTLDIEQLAYEQTRDATLLDSLKDSSLQLEQYPLPFSTKSITCDTSSPNPRPFVPTSMWKRIFEHFHSFSHPRRKATLKLIAERFVWPNMRNYIKNYTQSCLICQKTKIQRHTKSPPSNFAVPDGRFRHLHVDLVGPLTEVHGHQYILTY